MKMSGIKADGQISVNDKKKAPSTNPKVVASKRRKGDHSYGWWLRAAAIGAVVAYVMYYMLKDHSPPSTVAPEAKVPISYTGTINKNQAPIKTVSIIMIAHNENPFLKRTFDSIMSTSPMNHLTEIVFVDDASDPPAKDVLETLNIPILKLVRNDVRKGLVKARMQGADASTGDLLVFLDAHIRTFPKWLEPMLEYSNQNYRRITFPLIPVLNGTTWEPIGKFAGINMVFDWRMDFTWLNESSDLRVPTMSGGLMGITRKWYYESGEYDEGQLLWGGENVEQSVRTWLCGGEIIRAPTSVIGHMFRETAPYSPDIPQIHMNKARAVDVWFDDYKEYYYRANPFDKDRRATNESLASRFAIKERLGCKPFQYFVDMFRDILEANDVLPRYHFHLRNILTNRCLEAKEYEPNSAVHSIVLVSAICDEKNHAQVFIPDSWKRIRNGKFTNECLTGDSTAGKPSVTLEQCSAHVPAQKEWKFTEIDSSDGTVKKPAGPITKSEHQCLTVLENGSSAVLSPCKKFAQNYEPFWISKYNHALYK